MAVRTKSLVNGATMLVGGGTLYTCPAGETTIVKQLVLFNGSAAPQSLQVLHFDGTNSNVLVFQSVAGLTPLRLGELFIVLQPGDVLQGSSALGTGVFSAYGTQLEGVAD